MSQLVEVQQGPGILHPFPSFRAADLFWSAVPPLGKQWSFSVSETTGWPFQTAAADALQRRSADASFEQPAAESSQSFPGLVGHALSVVPKSVCWRALP